MCRSAITLQSAQDTRRNDKWVYDIVSAPSTKFMGNSVEIYPVGACPHCMQREQAEILLRDKL